MTMRIIPLVLLVTALLLGGCTAPATHDGTPSNEDAPGEAWNDEIEFTQAEPPELIAYWTDVIININGTGESCGRSPNQAEAVHLFSLLREIWRVCVDAAVERTKQVDESIREPGRSEKVQQWLQDEADQAKALLRDVKAVTGSINASDIVHYEILSYMMTYVLRAEQQIDTAVQMAKSGESGSFAFQSMAVKLLAAQSELAAFQVVAERLKAMETTSDWLPPDLADLDRALGSRLQEVRDDLANGSYDGNAESLLRFVNTSMGAAYRHAQANKWEPAILGASIRTEWYVTAARFGREGSAADIDVSETIRAFAATPHTLWATYYGLGLVQNLKNVQGDVEFGGARAEAAALLSVDDPVWIVESGR